MQSRLQRGLARSRVIEHPVGVKVRTPLLVPAFSSKGLRLKGSRSEVRACLKVAAQVLEESFLVSAYDIYYKHLPKPSNLPKVRLVFLDSGGYETADAYDLSAIFRDDWPVDEWDESRMKEVLTKWPKTVPTVFVSYDCGRRRVALKRQIEDSHNLFSGFPEQLHEFLIKPERTWKGYLDWECICTQIGRFKDFHMLGVTEKELGRSLLERMINVAKIRLALDSAGIDIPLHVFGSLDPVNSALYFLAGAEIFDGLTWLRYGYWEGITLYYQNYRLLNSNLSIAEIDDKVTAYMLLSNLSYLGRLRDHMMSFLLEGSFAKFETSISERIEEGYDRLRTEIGGQI